jgi:endogenous inhibitor of DNA gyrase (YacG/DUF329 family)
MMKEWLEQVVPEMIKYLNCHTCGKQVSTGFIPIPTDTPDGGIIVRAWIECPECIQEKEASHERRI